MQIDLQHLDLNGLALGLPGSSALPQPRVVVRSAKGLAGEFEQTASDLRLSQVRAAALALEALELLFGSVRLTQEQDALLGQVKVEFQRTGETSRLDLDVADLHAAQLGVEVAGVSLGPIEVSGETHLRAAHLWTRDGDGGLEAVYLRFGGFRLRLGELQLAAPELGATQVRLGWGEDGFQLSAATIEVPKFELYLGDLRLAGSGLVVEKLDLHGPQISVGAVRLAHSELDLRLTGPGTQAEKGQSEPTERAATAPFFDWQTLDGLAGDFDVDLAVDLTVPFIGSRRATHHFRIPIEAGALDYMRLEGDLSTLENALLDFAVRDGMLVLERGIPMLKTRGRGKPILVWKLDTKDLALAQRNRVRLAKLPEAKLAKEAEEEAPAATKPDAPARSAIALRRLGLGNLDTHLTLAAASGASDAALRTLRFQTLALSGDVYHEADGPPSPGRLKGQLTRLEAGIVGWLAGTSRIDLQRLALARIGDLDVTFCGLHPQRARCVLESLALDKLQLSPTQSEETVET